MNKILIAALLLASFNSFAFDKGHNEKRKPIRHHQPNPYCIFDVLPLNSPVKESIARFLIKVPNGFDIDQVTYQVRNAGRIFETVKAHQKINLVNSEEGKELRISVSKLPPGFYQLFVKITDRKFKVHAFKTKFKDHASFVIDNSLQVPMPDSRLNDKTIAGIDSDNDGIRDDIQRWINEKFSSQPEVKLAVKQVAMGRQLELLSVNNREQSVSASKKHLNNLLCLSAVVGIDKKSELNRELESKLLNTKDRLYADIKSNANFNGEDFDLPNNDEEQKALCEFDSDSI